MGKNRGFQKSDKKSETGGENILNYSSGMGSLSEFQIRIPDVWSVENKRSIL